ncbi:ATP-binding cassette domain-containing protein, partial [Tabrizicola sp. WMC-M-20]
MTGGQPTPQDGVVLDGVGKSFPSGDKNNPTVVLHEISLTVAPGRFVAVLGPSGCGKTTLLRLADGLSRPDTGSVRIFGRPPQPGPDIGFVFQSFRLIPWASVAQNIAFGLADLGLSKRELDDRVAHHINLVGLTRVANAFPA